jgi:hypothetical protein
MTRAARSSQRNKPASSRSFFGSNLGFGVGLGRGLICRLRFRSLTVDQNADIAPTIAASAGDLEVTHAGCVGTCEAQHYFLVMLQG